MNIDAREFQSFLSDEEFEYFGKIMNKMHKLSYLDKALQIHVMSTFLFQDPVELLKVNTAGLSSTLTTHFKGDRDRLKMVIEGIMYTVDTVEKL